MAGLNKDPATVDGTGNWKTLDYAIYLKDTGFDIRESGVTWTPADITYTTSTVFCIVFSGSRIIYYKDGVAIRTVVVERGQQLYADIIIYTIGAGINSLIFGHDAAYEDPAPQYKGRYPWAHPTSWNPGDWWTVIDTDAGDAGRPGNGHLQRGIWFDDNGSAVRLGNDSGVNAAKLASALPDILWATNNGYGTVSQYGDITFITNFVASKAFIDQIGSRDIVIQQGGAVRAGGFDLNGNFSGAVGFWLGATGLLKAKGGEFQGAVNSGVITDSSTETLCKLSLMGKIGIVFGYVHRVGYNAARKIDPFAAIYMVGSMQT